MLAKLSEWYSKIRRQEFYLVPVQAGLPDDKLALFYKCDNGDLFISHSSGISRYDPGSNRFILIYTNDVANKIPVRFIGQDGAIVYFYCPDAVIKGMDANTYKITSQVKTGFPGYIFGSPSHPKFSDNIIKHKVALLLNFTLYLLDLKAGKIISRSDSLFRASSFFLRLKTEDEVLYTSYKINGPLQLYNFTSQVISSHPVIGMKGTYIARSNVYAWRNKWLLSLNNRVYEIDTSLRVLHAEMVNFENMPVAGTEIISQIKEDNFGNLYIVYLKGWHKKNYPE